MQPEGETQMKIVSRALPAALLLAFQQFLIADRVPAHCFIAFLNNHWVGAVIFAGIIGHYYGI